MVGGSVTEDMAAYVSSDSFQFSNNLKIQLYIFLLIDLSF